MSETTSRLALPYLLAEQAQKHVTHNEALRLLDGLVHLSVENRTTSTPPGSPSEGDCYIVAAGGSGAWASWDGDVAMYSGGSWYRLSTFNGMRAWDLAAGELVVRLSGAWTTFEEAMSMLRRSTSVDVAESQNAGTTGLAILEETLTGLSGASVDSAIQIPSRAICLGVSTRTVATVTGATSYDCGIAGETSKFGGSLGVAAGSTNAGVIGPQAFYADAAIRLTANGANFSGGDVRIAVHYLTVGVPS